jgi:hypothetical protein
MWRCAANKNRGIARVSAVRNLMRSLWREDAGGLVSAEYLLIGTLLTIGLLVGIAAVQSALLTKLGELATLIGS